VSVAGFDGVAVGALTAPTLSTVMQPSARIAATAVDLLLGLIAGERRLGPTLLNHALRLGDSTAVPAAQAASSTAPVHTAGVPVV
jgi:DNA-binding LacI/PurR family transcriptional regulator